MIQEETNPFTSTSFEIAGYEVVRSLGVVRGIVVRSRSVIGNFAANIQTIFGGNISIYTRLCEQARADAFQMMLAHAGQQGGNGVIGVRYDATEISPGVTEVICYGTAVLIQPRQQTPPPVPRQETDQKPVEAISQPDAIPEPAVHEAIIQSQTTENQNV